MMKNTKSSGLRYSEAFKQHVIELLLTGSMSMNQLAKELGITLDSLRTWKAKYLQRAGSVQRDGQKVSAADLEKELRKMNICADSERF